MLLRCCLLLLLLLGFHGTSDELNQSRDLIGAVVDNVTCRRCKQVVARPCGDVVLVVIIDLRKGLRNFRREIDGETSDASFIVDGNIVPDAHVRDAGDRGLES